MVLAGNYTIVAFSQGDVATDIRKMILVRVNVTDFTMDVHVIESNAVPYKLTWNETNGLTIAGNVNNLDGTSSVHLLRVSYFNFSCHLFIDFS